MNGNINKNISVVYIAAVLKNEFTNNNLCFRCAVDKLRMDTNGSLLILCTDTVGKNTTTGRILQVIKGKDYGMPVRSG